MLPLAAGAQGGDYETFMAGIERNNPDLLEARKTLEATTIGLRRGLNPADPEVEMEYNFGREREAEVALKQQFDFPTAYRYRKQIAGYETDKAEITFEKERNNILTDASVLYIRAIGLRKKIGLLRDRQGRIAALERYYKQMTERGETTVLEQNKIAALSLNTLSELRIRETEYQGVLDRLRRMNGGEAVEIGASEFPVLLGVRDSAEIAAIAASTYDMQLASIDTLIGGRELKLSRSSWIPSLSVGYKATIADKKLTNGLLAGISIPLWQNRNRVKFAKADRERLSVSSANTYSRSYTELIALWRSFRNYETLYGQYRAYLGDTRSEALLEKALQAGEISMIDYLVELNIWYETVDTALQVEQELYLTQAEIGRYLPRR